MQDAVVVSCISLCMSRRCSDLLATALQTEQHPANEEQQPARRLRNGVSSTLTKCSSWQRCHRVVAKYILR